MKRAEITKGPGHTQTWNAFCVIQSQVNQLTQEMEEGEEYLPWFKCIKRHLPGHLAH